MSMVVVALTCSPVIGCVDRIVGRIEVVPLAHGLKHLWVVDYALLDINI
jgi:hypothetical protein